MSTELKSLNKMTTLTRFWGGQEKGVCVQVTQSDQDSNTINPLGIGYIQLNRDEAGRLGEMLLQFAADPMDPDLDEV